MIFKTKGSIQCTKCGYTKPFEAEADVCATDLRDSTEIAAWDEDSINLCAVLFDGLCPDCKYNKAA